LRDSAGSAGPDWLPDAITAIRDAGPAGIKLSAIADLVGRSRPAIRTALRGLVERGELVYRDNGPHSVYVHPDHA
jgi:DNA-binding IclR family transcriptional regulator